MQLNVIHISDIHFHESSNPISKKVDAISQALFPVVRAVDRNVIAISGDIAFSGNKCEYAIVEEFICRMRKLLENEAGLTVDEIMTAGNHDCVLKPVPKLRERTIQSIIANPDDTLDEEAEHLRGGAS
ncbi:hypothetical protein BPMI_02472c [Candidatus Burkholderia pumila]|uniref:Calcineurin-like phosphoesterase domain-containing protein n=1 Tax=Candidatus Burkholderia pumila TaxID=1090375 RepID=A0ABR5HJQ3_9BURK|nr:hypothetical protein BPMI_02472c [Candidatus Burkholderia pumila]